MIYLFGAKVYIQYSNSIMVQQTYWQRKLVAIYINYKFQADTESYCD